MDQSEKMLRCIGDCSPNVVSSYQLSRKAEKLLKDSKDLKDKTFQEIARRRTPGGPMRLPVGSMVGRAAELKQLQGLFSDTEVSIIGIHGMAGVGKTMLLEKFWHDFQTDTYLKYWINMENCRNVEDAQNVIVEKLRLHLNENEKQDPNAIRHRIFGYLRSKNFLLVLDKVWKPVDLNEVGISTEATSQCKFKVILTTQLEYVCDQMNATKLKVKCLGQEAAWLLFRQTVGDDSIYSDTWVKNDAQILANKCGGLPLALVALGRAMKGKRTANSWSLAIKQLDSAPWEITYMEEELLRHLKPSYANLDNKLKTCFLYCCLFPVNLPISKERIICYCIGEGIVSDIFDEATHMFNKGHDLLASLIASSLLEESDDDSNVKMHPIIRVLPLLMECEHGAKENKWFVRTQMELREVPEVEKWGGAERISLMNNKINLLNDIPDSPSLVTLLMPHNKLEKMGEGFFRSMRNLKVLDLSNTDLKEIPADIGELVALQYLNFSSTKLESLPQELGNLVRLRTLLLSKTSQLASIPEGLIARLSELRFLGMCVSYEHWKVGSEGDGVDFEELKRLKKLKVLGISINTVSALKKLGESDRLCKSVRELEIRLLSQRLKTLSTAEHIWDCKSLKWLRLSLCKDLEKLEIDMVPSGNPGGDVNNESPPPLPNLTDLYLTHLLKAKITWKNGSLKNLSHLEINSCMEMRNLIHCDDDDDLIKEAEKKEEMLTKEAEKKEEILIEINILPNLKRLNLFNLPELESLSCGRRPLAFPSLEVLEVRDCPKLKKFPVNAAKLRQIYGQRSWANKLDLPKEFKTKFESCFKASSTGTSSAEADQRTPDHIDWS